MLVCAVQESKGMGELGIMGGTRDFLPDEMIRREYVIDTLKAIFRRYGFEPLETPSIERWETLAGKYGEEGEKLIYHVVSSGSLADLKPNHRPEHALRYDLTVPLARVVGMHGDEMIPDPTNPKKQLRRLPRPFKRYQVQPVWRGDRPGEGRYREFYQCDADVVGSESLLVEAELVAMVVEAFQALGFAEFSVRLNHRQLLRGLIECAGIARTKEATVLSSIDKLDKLTPAQVRAELTEKELASEQIERLFSVIELADDTPTLIAQAREKLAVSAAAMAGLAQLETLFAHLRQLAVDPAHYRLDFSLARGLDYYTGAIWEIVTAAGVGSVGAGGRYDGLIHALSGGKVDQPACGTSFGLDRILRAMEKLNMFSQIRRGSEVLVLHFGDPGVSAACCELVCALRSRGVRAELGYNDSPFTPNAMRQQLGYANEKGMAFAVIIGPDEFQEGVAALRDLRTRLQEKIALSEVAEAIGLRLVNA